MRWQFQNNNIIAVENEGIEKQTEKATLVKYCRCNIWLSKKEISIKNSHGKTFVKLPVWLNKKKFN